MYDAVKIKDQTKVKLIVKSKMNSHDIYRLKIKIKKQ
jgi:hypothetical protein